MSDWLDDDIKTRSRNRIKKVKSSRGKLTKKQKEKVQPLWKEHYNEQFGKEDPILYQDEWGGTIMYLKFPNEKEGTAREVSNGNYLIFPVSPLLNTTISCFIPPTEDGNFDERLYGLEGIIRGKMKVQYKPVDSDEDPMHLNTFLSTVGYDRLVDVPKQDYFKSYTFNLRHVIARVD